MKITGSLLKMKSEISQPIKYYLPIGSESVEMNSLINFVKKNVKNKTGININLEIKIIEYCKKF